MDRCRECGKILTESDCYPSDRKKNWCKDCRKNYRRNWRAKYKEEHGECDSNRYNRTHAERFAQLKDARIKRLYEWINELKQAPCMDCKKTFHPVCMDFDHIENGTKIKGITRMINETYSKESILAELKKCELVCANCHRLRTWASGREMPWYEKNRKYDRSTWV
jgi:hypothetical protein